MNNKRAGEDFIAFIKISPFKIKLNFKYISSLQFKQ